MKKVFLLGTMLGVASAALAFGGMFNHGSKSTTYKGGVNAIGVHFGGEKSPDSKGDATEVCAEGVLKDRFGHCNICENGNVYLSYMDDPCGTETEMEGDCVSNADCESDEFCNLQDPSWNCEKPNTGFCQPIGEIQGITTEDLGDIIVSSYNDDYSLSWWAADNWCKAQGKNLIHAQDLGCYFSGTDTLITKDNMSDSYFYCCAKGQNCSSWGDFWSWDDELESERFEITEEESKKYSPTVFAIEQVMGGNNFWTADNMSSCRSICFYMWEPTIRMDYHWNNTEDGYKHALCK